MSVKMWDRRDEQASQAEEAQAAILVVEDFEGVREALAELLATEGYEVAAVANGVDAMEYLRSHPAPSLILLDLLMPKMDGWEFIQALRRAPQYAGLPIILLSGVEDLRGTAPALGVDGYLRKPVDPQILLQVIEMYCG